MYRCNSCKVQFEKYHTLKETTGEKIYVCPFCKDTDFDEIQTRDENDDYLSVKKSDVVDFVVTAIGFINSGYPTNAKETLVELIKEMVDDTFFDYKDKLNTVSGDSEVSNLVSELSEILEVVIV